MNDIVETQPTNVDMNVKSMKEFIDVPDPIKHYSVNIQDYKTVLITWDEPEMNNRPLKEYHIMS